MTFEQALKKASKDIYYYDTRANTHKLKENK